MGAPNRSEEEAKEEMITNCHKNIMGTVSFDGKFSGMRKAQNFICYPMQDSGAYVQVQSDNRMGEINLDTGEVVMSPPASGHAGFLHLQIAMARKTAISFTLPKEELQTLRQWIKSTGGIEVGSSIVKSDNTGALAL